MKKVLFMIPTLGGGGAERVLVNLLNNLDRTKYEIHLLTLFNKNIYQNKLNHYIEYRYAFSKVFRGNIYIMKLLPPVFLWNYFIKEEYDIAVSFLEGPTTRILGGCKDKTKKICWIHTDTTSPKVFLKSYRNKIELTNTYNSMDSIIFVAKSAKKSFNDHFSNIISDSKVIYNAIDVEEVQKKSFESVEDVKFDEDTINIISVGRFIEAKGYKRLIRIIYRLKKENYNIHLYLLGEGELRHKYEELINNLKLEDYITLLGFKENPYKYVRKADLFICSSYREGFSTAVSESVVVGTPVVTTLCSGMEEMLGAYNEYGLITDNNDDALYEGVKRMLTEHGLLEYYKNKTIERGHFFSEEKTVKAVEELLDNL